jgi:predicted metal-binding membrane protein
MGPMSVAPSVPPVRRFGLSAREIGPAWAALAVVAALAWVITLRQARGMGVRPGTMGMALPLFLGMWVAMMTAMMFPSVAPVALLWVRAITRRADATLKQRTFRLAAFLSGYLSAWTAFGLAAFAALLGTERLVDSSPDAAKWLGVGLFAAAGIYQFTPLKDRCLRHCRSPMMAFLRYANFKGRLRDYNVGAHHGAYCVGCCWGLMIALIAVGVMNVAAMASLAAIIVLEKLSARGESLERLFGIALIAVAGVAAVYPEVMPGLHAADMGGM